MPPNIRLGWKRISVANALAYYTTKTVTAVISFYAKTLVFAL